MPDATPVYGLPMPNDTDTLKAAVKDIPRSLATQVESTLAGWAGVSAPTAWTNLTPVNSFTATAGSLAVSKIGSIIFLHVAVNRASAWAANTILTTLPVGYRPGKSTWFCGTDLAAIYWMEIATTGVVTVKTAGNSGIIADTALRI